MAIDPQFANQAHPDTSTTLDPVEKLKAQAKLQMAQTAAQLDDSPISGSTTPTPPHSSSPIVNPTSELECPSPVNSCLPKAETGPAILRSLPPAHIAKSIPCRFYAIGACKYGDSCAFSHSLDSCTGALAALPSAISIPPPNPPDAADGYGPPSAYILPPHPAQTYEEAAVRRFYGYCESPPLPPPLQPLDPVAIPASTSPASTTPEGPPIAPDQLPYYPPPSSHPNATYDAYYPHPPPPSAISHGFPSTHQVMSYGPQVSSPGYYPFHGSMPPHNVYAPMPPHGPQGYYELLPPADNRAFDGYPISHPISVGPEDATAPASIPHLHPNPEAMYYHHHQYHSPYPPPPPGTDGLPCAPTGDYLPNHPPVSDPDSSHYHHPPMDTQKEANHSSLKSVDEYSGHSLPAPHESYVAGPGALPPLVNSHGPSQAHSAHPSSGSGTLGFRRNCHHSVGNSNGSRRGHHAGRGGRPMRSRLSTGPNLGTCRAPSQGSGPSNPSPRPPLSSATAPSSTSGVLNTSPLPSSITADERSPRGPCSFFAENRCRFGDECIWAHVMPNGDDAREYGLNYVGPEVASKDGTLGSEVGYGNKMIRKMDGFDSRSIPGYALWEKRYKDPFRKVGPPRDSRSAGGDRACGKDGGAALAASSGGGSRPSMRQKVDELVQQRREGNIPGHSSSYRTNRAGPSGGSVGRSHHPPSTNVPPHTQLRHVVASASRTQRIPSVEDFPALRSMPSSVVPEKGLSNGNGHIKEERNVIDEDGSSNSCGTEASASTNATSTKDSPGLSAPKSVLPLIIEGGSFALAAARGASVPTPAIKQKPVASNIAQQASLVVAQSSVTTTSSAVAPTTLLSNKVEEAFKSLDIDSSTCPVVASA